LRAKAVEIAYCRGTKSRGTKNNPYKGVYRELVYPTIPNQQTKPPLSNWLQADLFASPSCNQRLQWWQRNIPHLSLIFPLIDVFFLGGINMASHVWLPADIFIISLLL